MRVSFIQLSVLVSGLFLSSVFGLFEDQAGEYDWKIDNIGVIQQSFTQVCKPLYFLFILECMHCLML